MRHREDQPGGNLKGRKPRLWVAVLRILLLAGVYFAAGKFGLSLAFVNASASAVWPPTGIALAALLLWGAGLWPGVFLGAFLVNIVTQGSFITTLGIASGNTVEALLGAWLVRRFAGGSRAFEGTASAFSFFALAALLSTIPSASLGVTSLCFGGFAQWHQYGTIWLTWWLGDAVSNLIIAPFVLIWFTQGWLWLTVKQALEAFCVLLALLAVGFFLFSGLTAMSGSNYPLSYLAILPLLWAAFRFEDRGAVSCALIMSGIALWGTRHGYGPFATADPNVSLLLLQTFMAIATLTALVMASLTAERNRVEKALRAASDELARTNTDLEKRVEERTARLRDVIDELEHFSYAIVHDLRAPLRSMQGFAEMLDQTYGAQLPPEPRGYLQRIKASSTRMDNLIIDALSYSKALGENLSLEPVNLAVLLRGITESYPNLQPPKVEISIEGEFPTVLGNVSGLTQCFSNLLGNAVKFVSPGITPRVRVWSEPGSLIVTAANEPGAGANGEAAIPVLANPGNSSNATLNSRNSSAPLTGGGQFVRIWVEDNGIGIPADSRERIFRMFERLSTTFEGTGIGLAIVRKVVQRMGGRVGVESHPGQGSRFWLELRRMA